MDEKRRPRVDDLVGIMPYFRTEKQETQDQIAVQPQAEAEAKAPLEVIAAAEDLLDGLWTRHDYPFNGVTIVRDGTAGRLRAAVANAREGR